MFLQAFTWSLRCRCSCGLHVSGYVNLKSPKALLAQPLIFVDRGFCFCQGWPALHENPPNPKPKTLSYGLAKEERPEPTLREERPKHLRPVLVFTQTPNPAPEL